MSVCLRMWLKLSCSTHGSPLLKLARYQGGGGQEKQGELATFQWHWALQVPGRKLPANHNGLFPAWHQARHVVYHNGFSEHSAIQYVTNGAVGTSPHLLQLELLDSSLIWGDGRALDAHPVGLSARQNGLPLCLLSLKVFCCFAF